MMVQIINQRVAISGSGDARYRDDVYINGNVTISGSGDIYFQSAFINGTVTISGTGSIIAQGMVIARKLTISGVGNAKGNFILTEKCTVSGVGSLYGKISTPKITVSGISGQPAHQIPFHQRADAMYASVVSAIETGGSPSILIDLFNQPFENLAAGEWNVRKMQTASSKVREDWMETGNGRSPDAIARVAQLFAEGAEFVKSGHLNEAIERFDQVLTLDPNFAPAWVTKGALLGDRERHEEALKCYDRALEIDPSISIAKEQREVALRNYAVQQVHEGLDLTQSGHTSEAMERFDQALTLEPNFAAAWVGKGNALGILKRPEEALKCFDRALEIDPSFSVAKEQREIALRNCALQQVREVLDLAESGHHNEAIERIDKVLITDPNFAPAWAAKGALLGDLERHEEAIECYDRALKIDPNLTPAKRNRDLVLSKIAEAKKQKTPAPPRSGETRQSSQSAIPPVKAAAAQPSIITIERTVYDPLTRDFVISTDRTLVNVRPWIERHDPASYWLVVCVHNHGDHTIDEWGIELDSSSSLKILEAAVEGAAGPVSLQTTHPKPWLVRSVLGVSHHRGIVIPRNGSRRVYFRLGSESCGVSHTIQGKFVADQTEAEIRAKQFQHSCDVATLSEVMRTDPEKAEQFTENIFYSRYDGDLAARHVNTYRLMHDITQCCFRGEVKALPGKMRTLIGALETAGASPKVIAPVRDLTALDLRDGMGEQRALQLLADETEKLMPHIIEIWMNETLKASDGHREIPPDRRGESEGIRGTVGTFWRRVRP